jgi:hypothetical protein
MKGNVWVQRWHDCVSDWWIGWSILTLSRKSFFAMTNIGFRIVLSPVLELIDISDVIVMEDSCDLLTDRWFLLRKTRLWYGKPYSKTLPSEWTGSFRILVDTWWSSEWKKDFVNELGMYLSKSIVRWYGYCSWWNANAWMDEDAFKGLEDSWRQLHIPGWDSGRMRIGSKIKRSRLSNHPCISCFSRYWICFPVDLAVPSSEEWSENSELSVTFNWQALLIIFSI